MKKTYFGFVGMTAAVSLALAGCSAGAGTSAPSSAAAVRRMKQHRQMGPHRQGQQRRQIFPEQSPLMRSGKGTALKGMEKPRRISREN